MPIMFNSILREAGLALADVRLVRHKDASSAPGRTPYKLWRDNLPQFEWYQATQRIQNRKKLAAPFWAVFLADTQNATMFAGLYGARYRGLLEQDSPRPHMDGVDPAGSCDVYDLTRQEALNDLIGRLFIDWGPGALAWVQHAARNDKRVTQLRTSFQEPDFPGFLKFIEPLSRIEKLPRNWGTALQSARGVYLLTCPKTKEQYVGSAVGEEGFLGRWREYARTGHGGNVGLKSREPSDYQVSILEVAGSSATKEEILRMEGLWQAKFQSREMGLNRNLAGSPAY